MDESQNKQTQYYDFQELYSGLLTRTEKGLLKNLQEILIRKNNSSKRESMVSSDETRLVKNEGMLLIWGFLEFLLQSM